VDIEIFPDSSQNSLSAGPSGIFSATPPPFEHADMLEGGEVERLFMPTPFPPQSFMARRTTACGGRILVPPPNPTSLSTQPHVTAAPFVRGVPKPAPAFKLWTVDTFVEAPSGPCSCYASVG